MTGFVIKKKGYIYTRRSKLQLIPNYTGGDTINVRSEKEREEERTVHGKKERRKIYCLEFGQRIMERNIYSLGTTRNSLL